MNSKILSIMIVGLMLTVLVPSASAQADSPNECYGDLSNPLADPPSPIHCGDMVYGVARDSYNSTYSTTWPYVILVVNFVEDILEPDTED